jgi:hypothetical protein
MNKLPFKTYANMNSELINKLEVSNVYRAYILSLTTDKEDKTDTTHEQLASFVNDSCKDSKETINTYKGKLNAALTDTNLVVVDTDRKGRVSRNTYKFVKGETFRNIGSEFYNVELTIKLKGYMIKLFNICNLNTLTVGLSKNEIYKLIGVTKSTQNKYNEELIQRGFLIETADGLQIDCPGMRAVDYKVKVSEETAEYLQQAYNVIISHVKALKHEGKITRKVLDAALKAGLAKAEYVVGLYMLNNFKDVKDINALVYSIRFGKHKTNLNTFTLTI